MFKEDVGPSMFEKKTKPLPNAEVSKERESSSDRTLDNFFSDINTPSNAFYIDKKMETNDLEQKMMELESLLSQLEEASFAERDVIERESSLLAQIPSITEDVRGFLEQRKNDPNTIMKEGAENESYISFNGEEKSVVKVSKERHDYDVVSVVKLMRNMCALELFQRNRKDFMSLEEGNMDIEVVFDNIAIVKDEEGRYKRIITQPFIEVDSIKAAMEGHEEYDDFSKAWKKFLEQIGLLQATAEVALDITDSSQGAKPSRGNVALTENVMVADPEEEGGEYVFKIIDLDVFDDPLMDTKAEKGEQNKFYAGEQIRKKGSLLSAMKVFVTNLAREKYVKPMQDKFTKKEMDK